MAIKKISLLIVLLGCATLVQAQNHLKKNELSVSYGIASPINITDQFSSILLSGLTGGYLSFDHQVYSGSINVEYIYRLNHTIGIGGAVSYEHAYREIIEQRQKVGTMHENYITVMPVFKCNWLNGGVVRLYSKAAAGVSLDMIHQRDAQSTEDDHSMQFAFQVSPLGIELGGSLCGFLEAGYGYQGMLQVGVKYRF